MTKKQSEDGQVDCREDEGDKGGVEGRSRMA